MFKNLSSVLVGFEPVVPVYCEEVNDIVANIQDRL